MNDRYGFILTHYKAFKNLFIKTAVALEDKIWLSIAILQVLDIVQFRACTGLRGMPEGMSFKNIEK